MTSTQSPEVPPIGKPYYGASLPVAVSRFFRKYAVFSGRASRSEFWWVQLFLWVVSAVIAVPATIWLFQSLRGLVDWLDTSTFMSEPPPLLPYLAPMGPLVIGSWALSVIWSLGTLVPGLALYWRRLHDANMSGWLFLLVLVANIIPLILCVMPSKPEGAKYDADWGHGYGPPGGYPAGGYAQPQPYAPPGYAPPGYAPPGYAPPGQPPAPPSEPVIGPDGLPRYPGAAN
ncbi:MAG: DUF805 domain-containing protein [Bifidobacteriaceae bacterium]|jgi:uncharacterized membrane protein YhaH (DUF805 family)|nr:DUF805 domain-containing protein [Bifidobacteriaceae bacterium]